MLIFRLPGVMFDCDCEYGKIGEPIKTTPNNVSYIMVERDQIVGAQCITLSRTKGIVKSQITVVRKYKRKLGVASQLWERMIKVEKPREIKVLTVTHRGHSLVESLREKYPKIEWKIETYPHIRSLRKSK